MKNKEKRLLVLLLILFAFCVLVFAVAHNSNTLETKLIGNWYNVYEDGEVGSLAASFYEDGSAEIGGTYGTGTWTIIEGNTIKITSFYGQIYLISDVSIQGNELTGQIYEPVHWVKK